MKNFSRFSILAMALVTLCSSAFAVDLSTNALVEIVDGIAITEVTPLNFGRLALADGTATIAATDGALTETANITVNGSNAEQGVFDVTSINGADVTASAVAGAIPAGLTLDNFTFSWDGGAAAAGFTMNATNVLLEVGADLTIDAANAAVTGGQANLPYTLSVVFN